MIPVLSILAFRKAPPMSVISTIRPSDAAIDATISTEEVAAVGDDRFLYRLLSCLLPPATRRALYLSKSPEAVNLSLINMLL
jgi:hypothetical protein